MNKLAIVILNLLSWLFVSAANAYPFIHFEKPFKSAVSGYRDAKGLQIPPASACERILLEAERDLERPLTTEEISRNLKEILELTGDSLVFPMEEIHFSAMSW